MNRKNINLGIFVGLAFFIGGISFGFSQGRGNCSNQKMKIQLDRSKGIFSISCLKGEIQAPKEISHVTVNFHLYCHRPGAPDENEIHSLNVYYSDEFTGYIDYKKIEGIRKGDKILFNLDYFEVKNPFIKVPNQCGLQMFFSFPEDIYRRLGNLDEYDFCSETPVYLWEAHTESYSPFIHGDLLNFAQMKDHLKFQIVEETLSKDGMRVNGFKIKNEAYDISLMQLNQSESEEY